jgi:hypothetical protein
MRLRVVMSLDFHYPKGWLQIAPELDAGLAATNKFADLLTHGVIRMPLHSVVCPRQLMFDNSFNANG